MSKVIVTGCSSGIGYYLAENIIKSGYKVIGLARNEPKEKYSLISKSVILEISLQ